MNRSYKWMFISSIIIMVISLVMNVTVFFIKPPNKDNQNQSTEQQQPSGGEQTPAEPEVKLYDMSPDGKYLYFGEYPQTLKADNVSIVTTKPDNKGCFVGDDGNRYYLWNRDYFKVEPLKWRVLTQEDGKAFVVCDVVVAGLGCYENLEQVWLTSDYKYSNLRKYMIDDFYNRAFEVEEKEIIQQTLVDNSIAQTATPDADDEHYTYENTNDYIFALSYAELTNPEYGFSENNGPDENRKWRATDFAYYASDVQPWVYTYDQYLNDLETNNEDNFSLIGYVCGGFARASHDGWSFYDLQWDGSIITDGGPNYENVWPIVIPAMWIEL